MICYTKGRENSPLFIGKFQFSEGFQNHAIAKNWFCKNHVYVSHYNVLIRYKIRYLLALRNEIFAERKYWDFLLKLRN